MCARYSPADDQQDLTRSAESQQRTPEQLHPTDMQLITPLIDENSQWMHAHTAPDGYEFFHPMPITYSELPITTMSPSTFAQGGYIGQDLLPDNMQSRNWSESASNPTIGTASSSLFNPPASVWQAVPNFPMTGLPQSQMAPSSNLAERVVSPAHPPSRQQSPGQQSSPDLSDCGYLNPETRTWTCAYPSCSSKAIFNRPCDLRKHFNRHSKNYFCRHEGCSQTQEGGFSSKKDRARHESKHNPGVDCEWDGCERVFSRVDNMRNHMARSE
ncbi:MAG: hypothetical protein GOMPHAMPRED_006630 [Gomphillus americanus]|uniref:C2H2-type domain-containing protein n=1 Tax=Gomphillus americanus TaxID=1940652 RepID=A0A8H3ILQ2_9LECA|nr:MAG: hypothetical protein GOMPHAMPRED_006630 [Gomphillus americanus]